MLELNALLLVHSFLLFERAVVEQLLQSFIRVVDAQLFKTVLLEDLESENVQESDKLVPRAIQVLVDLLHLHLTGPPHSHNPIEQFGIQLLRQRITVLIRLLHFIPLSLSHMTTQRNHRDGLSRTFTHANSASANCFFQRSRRHAQQLRNLLQHLQVLDLAINALFLHRTLEWGCIAEGSSS